MAQQNIGVGTVPNDGTGDTLRTAMIKTQNNFSEFYAAFTPTLASNNVLVSNTMSFGNSTVNTSINSTSFIMTSNTLTIGTSNIAGHTAAMSNGYATMANGLKFLWGTLITANNTGQLITFSTNVGVAFATNCFSITATANSITVDVAVTTVNSTAITLITNSATATTAYWQAWGI